MPNIDPVELEVQKANTEAFINAKWEDVDFDITSDQQTSRGGRLSVVTASRRLRVRVVEPGGSGQQLPYRTPNGVVDSLYEFLVISRVEDDLGVGWEFEYDGARYRFSSLLPFNGYENRGVAIRV